MANVVIDAAWSAAGAARRRRAQRDRTGVSSPSVLGTGESDAHPPEVAHWDLPVRAFVVLGLTALSWAVIGGGLFLLLHH